jgi:hypothetical protein
MNQMAATAALLQEISHAVYHSLTQLFNITMTFYIAKSDCQICTA